MRFCAKREIKNATIFEIIFLTIYIKDHIADFFKKSNYKDHINAIKFYEEFFEFIELELNHPLKVVEIAFPAPKKCQVYPRQALGMPIAYLVRKANCVSILSIKKLEQPEIESWKTANESMKQLKRYLSARNLTGFKNLSGFFGHIVFASAFLSHARMSVEK